MHALLPAGIFVIIALNSLMMMYGRQTAYHQVFTAAFSIGLASLFYLPLAYLLLLVWFTLVTYRVSTWREYIISIIGFATPVVYYMSWLFWNDNLESGLQHASAALFRLIRPERISLFDTIWLSVSAFILVITMFAILNIMSDKLISLRRKAWVLFNFSFTALIAVFVAGWPILNANYIFVIPLSFFLTGSFSLIKRPFWFEVLAIGYLLLLVVMRVVDLING
jgi:hypothetical protein